MRVCCVITCILILVCLHITSAQLPPRLNIPGALLVQGARPAPLRPQRINPDFGPKPRRPISNALPAPLREIRPVVEEEQEDSVVPTSNFDAEVNKLGISALNSAVRQAADEAEEQNIRPSPLPFRPERPVPVTRDQIRDRPLDVPVPRPLAVPRPLQVARPEQRPLPVPRPVIRQERPRQELDDEEENIPVRRQKPRPQAPIQQFRPAPAPQRPAPRPPQYDEDESTRRKKPTVQILRKYRTDNEDGSITWGFENEDGTFKEETLGIDCITRGKYGYIDPDGVRREYSYESGNKCDQREPYDEEEEEILSKIQPKKPLNIGKPQFRPSGPQY